MDKNDIFRQTFKVKMLLYFLITKYEHLQIHFERVVSVVMETFLCYHSMRLWQIFPDSVHNNLNIMQ